MGGAEPAALRERRRSGHRTGSASPAVVPGGRAVAVRTADGTDVDASTLFLKLVGGRSSPAACARLGPLRPRPMDIGGGPPGGHRPRDRQPRRAVPLLHRPGHGHRAVPPVPALRPAGGGRFPSRCPPGTATGWPAPTSRGARCSGEGRRRVRRPRGGPGRGSGPRVPVARPGPTCARASVVRGGRLQPARRCGQRRHPAAAPTVRLPAHPRPGLFLAGPRPTRAPASTGRAGRTRPGLRSPRTACGGPGGDRARRQPGSRDELRSRH